MRPLVPTWHSDWKIANSLSTVIAKRAAILTGAEGDSWKPGKGRRSPCFCLFTQQMRSCERIRAAQRAYLCSKTTPRLQVAPAKCVFWALQCAKHLCSRGYGVYVSVGVCSLRAPLSDVGLLAQSSGISGSKPNPPRPERKIISTSQYYPHACILSVNVLNICYTITYSQLNVYLVH